MIKTRKLTPHFGVEISGVDLARPLEPAVAAELKEIFNRERLLYFADQHFSPDDQVRAMEAFGNVISESPSRDKVSYVTSKKGGLITDTGRLLFHSDYQFTEPGSLHAISLYATEMEAEEPTVFANMVRAAAILPADLREQVSKLDVVQLRDYSVTHSEYKRSRLSNRTPDTPEGRFFYTTHPLIRKHPATGEDVLNVSQLNTSHIEGWDEAQSDILFAALEPYQYQDDNCYTHHWKLNDLLIWDNVALQHGRGPLTDQRDRVLRRVTVNPHDVPTMLRNARPDPVRFPQLQWWT